MHIHRTWNSEVWHLLKAVVGLDNIHTCSHSHIHIYIRTQMHTYVHAYPHIHAYVRAYTCRYIHGYMCTAHTLIQVSVLHSNLTALLVESYIGRGLKQVKSNIWMFVAERISYRQIIMQQVRRYSRVPVCMYVCMYVYMSAKNSGLSIVGSVKHNCTAACALHCVCHPYYHKLSPTKNV